MLTTDEIQEALRDLHQLREYKRELEAKQAILMSLSKKKGFMAFVKKIFFLIRIREGFFLDKAKVKIDEIIKSYEEVIRLSRTFSRNLDDVHECGVELSILTSLLMEATIHNYFPGKLIPIRNRVYRFEETHFQYEEGLESRAI